MKPQTLLKVLLPSLLAAGIILTALPASAALKHRYSFNEAPGSTTVIDSIRGSNGVARLSTVQGGGAGTLPTFDGTQVTLDGVSGYIDLPNRLLAGLTNVSFEFWVTWTSGGTWARILDFGNVAGVPEDTDGTRNSGTGTNYLFLGIQSPGPRFALTPTSNGAGGESPVNSSTNLTQNEEHHLVVTWGPSKRPSMYIDGNFVGSGTYDTAHALSFVNDINNWLGRSQWGDPFFGGSYNEFRMHDSMLGQLEVLASKAGGPNSTNYTPENPTSISLVVNSNVFVGSTQTPTVDAIFPTYGNIIVGGAELTNLTSSAASIVRVEAGNVLRAMGSGTATITGMLGGRSSVATITVTIPVVFTALKHRYSFNEPNGSTTVTESIGGAAFAGTVNPPVGAGAPVVITNGEARFPGATRATAGYIDLPDGMISSAFTNVTVEFWFTYNPATGNTWGRVFDFGNSSKGSDPTVNAGGLGYITFTPRNGGGNPQMEFRTEAPFAAVAISGGPAFPVGREVHVVCSFAAGIGYSAMYIDGALRVSGGTPLYGDPPALYQLNQLVDVNMWLSASAYNDPQVDGRLNELRIHEGLLSELAIALSRRAGPNALPISNPGTLQSVSLNAPPLYINNPVPTQAALLGTYQNVTDVDITPFLGVQLQSSDTNVFTVTAAGLMTPISLGTASLIASYQTFSATSLVSVLAPTALSVTNLPASMNLGAGTLTVPLFANFAGGISNVNVTGFTGVTRGSSATNVATVTAAGVITATGAGTSTITSTYGGATNQALLTVVAPSSVYVTNLPATRDAGSVNFTVNLLASYPDGTTNLNVTGATGVFRSSSDTNVATITGAGVITVRSPGTTTIISAFGGQTNQATLTVVTPAGFARGALIHRYSFSEAKDTTTVNDSVGGKHGEVRNVQAGSANENFTGTGQFSMGPGTTVSAVESTNAYVNLPNGLISGLSSVTIEGWYTWRGGAANQRIFDFGMSSGLTDGSGGTASTNYLEDIVVNPGRNYMFLTPAGGADNGIARFALDSDTGNTANAEAPNITASIAITRSNLSHFAVVYDYPRGVARLYINGQRAGSGTTPYPLSVVDDRNNWLGRSQWVDPMFNGSFDEFRIYSGPALDADIAADFAAGPNALPANLPTLGFTRTATQLTLSWPTNAGAFTLKTSPVLGTGASWGAAGTPTVVGSNFEVTVPTSSGNGAFYRLEQ